MAAAVAYKTGINQEKETMTAMAKPKDVNRKFNDVCQLTPYEQRMWDLFTQGLSYKEIAKAMGSKNINSIPSRMKIIREKLEVASYA